jgi:sugar phosphate isomerase/epimerase
MSSVHAPARSARPLTVADLRRFAINQITTNSLDLPAACELYARHGIGGIGLWRNKVSEVGLARARQAITDNKLLVSSINVAGLFSQFGRKGFQRQVDETRATIDEAHQLDARTVCMVAGGLAEGERDLADARRMFEEGLEAVLPHARAADVRLMLEPLHPMYLRDWSTLVTLRAANDLCDRLGKGVGLSLDVYHTFWDPDFEREVLRACAVPGRLGILVISDWLTHTRSLNDRGMIGDGQIDLRGIRALVENAANCDGLIELEIFSDEIWAQPPEEVVARARERFLTCA